MTENNTLVINKTEYQTDLDNTVLEVDEFETNVMNYVLLLHPDDKLFLNFKNIYHDGNNYIKNINGEEYLSYKKERQNLLNKYSTKKENYYLDITNESIKVFKIKDGKLKEALYKDSNLTLIKLLKKPTSITHLDEELKKMHKSLQQFRFKLQTEYKTLVNDTHLDALTKENFVKKRNIFIKKINDYYTKQYYYNKSNGILTSNKDILLNRMDHYFPENAKTPIPRLSNKNVNLKPELITQLNQLESQNLDIYYGVLNNLNNTNISEKEKKESIINYLKNKNNTKDISKIIEKKIKRTLVNTIITQN
tara:strand:+ start:462 stop:1382 length:921 start_codon:yes stop_codon:yes gene_type:complete